MLKTGEISRTELSKAKKILVLTQWIGLIWVIIAVLIIIYSNIILISGHSQFMGITPFNVKDPVATAWLLFPGVVILGLATLFLRKEYPVRSSYKATFTIGLILGFVLSIILMLGLYEGKKTRKDYPSSWDSNRDGKTDVWSEYSNGQLVRYIYDQNYDGTADAWQYYRSGSQYRAESDENRDGQVDIWQYFDPPGELNRIESDKNQDGKVDVWQYFDPPGELNRIEFDRDHDDKVDYWEYYKKGERYKYTADNDRNGIVDEWGSMKNGLITECNWSFQNDKIVDKKATYKNGRKISETYDRDRNGKFDELIILDEFERVVDVKKEGKF